MNSKYSAFNCHCLHKDSYYTFPNCGDIDIRCPANWDTIVYKEDKYFFSVFCNFRVIDVFMNFENKGMYI